MNRNRLVATLVASLLMAGCSAGSGGAEPTTGTTAATSRTASSSPTRTPTDSAPARAEEAVVAFWRLRDELASDPSRGVTQLAEVARGQALDLHRRSLNAQAAQGWKQVGSTVVTAQSAKASDKSGEYMVTACVNVEKVNIVDAEGKSHVPPARPIKSAYSYTVQQEGSRWYLIEDLLVALTA